MSRSQDGAYDPTADLVAVEASSRRVAETISGLDAEAITAPSLLPGWTRGHVAAHLEGNAHSLVNLLTWARTGVETPQYTSSEARDAYISEHAVRTAAEHAAGIAAADAALAEAARAVPTEAWSSILVWRGGATRPASSVLAARLQELEIHHVDLGVDYSPAHWDEAFTAVVLDKVTKLFGTRDDPFDVGLQAVDTEARWTITADPSVEVVGPQAALLAWITGRSPGDGLVATGRDGGRVPLPAPPAWL